MSVSPLFALVIGINRYQDAHFPNLASAVNDADKFQQFLVESLGVSPPNIVNLRDDGATRVAIIGAIKSLITNPNIQKDDPIIIYFAGHGGRVSKPKEWSNWYTSGPQIEIMCPSDMSHTTEGEDCIVGIPDRTISALLHELSLAKGDNITLILDCCSSAGMSRNIHESDIEEYNVRQIFNAPPVLEGCDRDIWSTSQLTTMSRGLRLTPLGFSGGYHGSHVLLAACGVSQVAMEHPRFGGLFTHQLLRVLKEVDDMSELTYMSLMHRLNMPARQTPHCVGLNADRRLFNKRATRANLTFSPCRYDADDNIILEAGDAQGVAVGSKYGVHGSILDPSQKNPQLDVLIVTRVNVFTAVLSPSDLLSGVPDVFYARKISNGPGQSFTVHCSDRKLLDAVLSDRQAGDVLGVIPVDDANSADLSLSVSDGKVIFYRNDPMVTSYIGTGQRFPYQINSDDHHRLRNVIRCAVNFKQHLRRTGEDILAQKIRVEFTELELSKSGGFETWLLVGENLLRDNLVASVGVDRMFGLTVLNQTDLPLYAYVFAFDPSDLTIDCWYMPALGSHLGKAGRVDPSIAPRSSLTLGYGDTATAPWTFGLRPGEGVDVGFFKIFLTTSPSNFSTLIQESPFLPTNASSRLVDTMNPSPPSFELWATKLATIVHRR